MVPISRLFLPVKQRKNLQEVQFPLVWDPKKLLFNVLHTIYYNIKGLTLGPVEEIRNIRVSKSAS